MYIVNTFFSVIAPSCNSCQVAQPEKGPSFHTGDFNRGYNDGFSGCSGGTNGRSDDRNDDGDNDSKDSNNNGNCKFGPGNCCPGSCYSRGVDDGTNGDFGDFLTIDPSGDCGGGEFFPRYYQGFIDGCIDAGNTKEICEYFTDE